MISRQRKNLATLSSYLHKFRSRKNRRFDMADFSNEAGLGSTNCGSCGCAVGHGPYAGIPKQLYESWNHYCLRAFGVEAATPKWCFLFGTYWSPSFRKDKDKVRNGTAEQAARRIDIFLDHGVPKHWSYSTYFKKEQ